MVKNNTHRNKLIAEIRNLAQSQGLNTVFTTYAVAPFMEKELEKGA